jgi:hypothetical protein
VADDLPDAYPEDSIIVRYGENTCTPEVFEERATAHRRNRVKTGQSPEWGISVNTAPAGTSADDIAARGRRPNPKYRFTTLGDIHKAGCRLADRIDEDGHTDILLPDPPGEEDYRLLSDCFREVGINPNPVPPAERYKQ